MRNRVRRATMSFQKKIQGRVRDLLSWLRLLGKEMHGKTYDIAYLNQFGSCDRVRDVLDGKIRPSVNFPDWKQFGAQSPEEFDQLAYESCGMTCLAMILRFFGRSTVAPIELFKQAFAHGCYQMMPNGEMKGLFHLPFVEFIWDAFGLRSQAFQYVGLNVIADEIACGRIVIASVNWEIREEEPRPKRRGGHLVIVTGVEKNRWRIKGFTIHNTSGTTPENQRHHFASAKNFEKCFSGNIISVLNPG
ncbi:MAG: C39 family peptidase [Patescibacteria group bacterium]